jgi:hypothetical protein
MHLVCHKRLGSLDKATKRAVIIVGVAGIWLLVNKLHLLMQIYSLVRFHMLFRLGREVG